MSFMGPTYGMWADTVDVINERTARLQSTQASLEEWKAHAKKLEEALSEVNQMYRSKAGEADGHAELKKLALQEIERLDPTNKLLTPSYRKAIYDKIKEQTVNELKGK